VRTSKCAITPRDRGDTFLVVLLITAALAILAAFTLPGLLYRKARPVSASACGANLKRLSDAIKVWALDEGKGTNDLPTDADIFGTTPI
jgi:hypothetical protein